MLLLCLFVMSFWNDMMILIIVRGHVLALYFLQKYREFYVLSIVKKQNKKFFRKVLPSGKTFFIMSLCTYNVKQFA